MSKLFKNHYRKQLLSFLIIVAAMLAMISANYVHAQTTVIDNSSTKYQNGSYELNDFIGLAVKVATIIWAISGSIALLMFVYGGVLFLISSGNSQIVERAKKTIIGAVIGLAIVFGSYAIVYFIMINVLGVKVGGAVANPFTSGWFK